MPVIKLVKSGTTKYIKIFKTFLQKHSYDEIRPLIYTRDSNKINYNFETQTKSYIQFKWRLTSTIILTIDFDEVGYVRVCFDDDQYLNINTELIPYLELVKNTIKEIYGKIIYYILIILC